MSDFDVFNGDADGLCALQQLRLEQPRNGELITGAKRDISLLSKVTAGKGDRITVLDISLDKNREALMDLLEAGATVDYFDHHYAGEIPTHSGLRATIEQAPDVGTSLLVDRYLGGRQRAWAVVGTFGDNFDESARRAAEPLALKDTDLRTLKELGVYLNYNGYGAGVEDLHFPPDALFRRLHPYADPLEFVNADSAFARLRDGYRDDMARAAAIRPESSGAGIYLFPAEPWARRVSGVYANAMAREEPERAHALLTRLPEGGFVVSVRAPLATRQGADELCRGFATGGGRPAAAGINRLPDASLDDFIQAFRKAFPD